MSRPLFVRLHRLLGLCFALPLVLIGLSGSVIVFDVELDEWLNPDLFRVTNPGAPALSPADLIARIEAYDSRLRVTYLALDEATSKGSVAYVTPLEGQELDFDEVFIDPVSGVINGTRMWGACCFAAPNFVPFMYKLHNRLLLPIDIGRLLNGAIAVVWTLLMLIGLWLTVPAAGRRLRRWLQTFTALSADTPHRKWLAWHRIFGLWLLPVLLIIALTGIGLGFEDGFSSLVGPLTEPPTVSAPVTRNLIGPDQALNLAREVAARHDLDLPAAYISLPADAGYYRIRLGDFHLPGLQQATVYIATDGRVAGLQPIAGSSTGDWLMAALQPLHAGRIAGLAGRILVCLAGIILSLLAASGFVMWGLRRNPSAASR